MCCISSRSASCTCIGTGGCRVGRRLSPQSGGGHQRRTMRCLASSSLPSNCSEMTPTSKLDPHLRACTYLQLLCSARIVLGSNGSVDVSPARCVHDRLQRHEAAREGWGANGRPHTPRDVLHARQWQPLAKALRTTSEAWSACLSFAANRSAVTVDMLPDSIGNTMLSGNIYRKCAAAAAAAALGSGR